MMPVGHMYGISPQLLRIVKTPSRLIGKMTYIVRIYNSLKILEPFSSFDVIVLS